MELQNGMKVIAPATCYDYFTVGKSYEVFEVQKSSNFGASFEVIDDFGSIASCLLNECRHLNGYNWVVIQQPSLKQRLLTLTEKNPNDMELGTAVRKLLRDE